MENNSIINAVKRLERAGSENSRATQKLFGAAASVAGLIEDMVPAGAELPRGYYVRKIHSNIGCDLFLCRNFPVESNYADSATVVHFIDGTGGYLHGDFGCPIPGQDRHAVLQFAEDVAGGLLDEIANWLEQRAVKAAEAAEVLENTKS